MSHHKTGTSRHQMSFGSLEDQIAPDNPVRIVDAFVDMLDLKTFGFQHMQAKQKGAPCFHPSMLLKIYFYGYMNRIRSSRKLETECERNIEVRWLCEGQVPSYHTISTFRTYKEEETDINHRMALKEVFRAFNRFLAGEDLFGKETVAVDGTKIRAQNARKKNYTEDKLNKKLELANEGIEEYLNKLDRVDSTENNELPVMEDKATLLNKLVELKERKTRYEGLQTELKKRQKEDPSVTQISLTDPEARSIVVNNSGHAEVSYNIVTAVDDKHCLIASFSTENTKDDNLLAPSMMAVKAEFDTGFAADMKENMSDNLNPDAPLIGLADKGFHTGSQLDTCREHNIITYVAIPQPGYSGKDKSFTKDNFDYETKGDVYVCPAGEELKTSGIWYDKKDRHGQVTNKFKRYIMAFNICQGCRFQHRCLGKTSLEQRHGRMLERSGHQLAVDENRERMERPEGKEKYKRRQAIVEHPFGTVKRSWGYYYTLLKGKEKVTGEYALVFACYNMRRAMTVLGVPELLEKMRGAKSLFWPVFEGLICFVLSRIYLERGFLLFSRAKIFGA
ncbi:MAG: IS1182 family transposase [Rhodococcus sp. (in: high G+C Gram-positive bacteria)]|uniref:IS1182 family transposase n=1 Tax=Rhodococcus sp. TaxID=1831 RepID=UPI002ADC7D16|nr:IS1182 family transposase [Rhodococcus sp. (in: high G+C Gram-positive bacteria)]